MSIDVEALLWAEHLVDVHGPYGSENATPCNHARYKVNNEARIASILSEYGRLVPAEDEGRLREALHSVTLRRQCPHGHWDVVHVAPAHFDGPACPECSDAEYADRMQREEPCVVCAALAATPEPR